MEAGELGGLNQIALAHARDSRSRGEKIKVFSRKGITRFATTEISRRAQSVITKLNNLQRAGTQNPNYEPTLQSIDALSSALDAAYTSSQFVSKLVPKGKGIVTAGVVIGAVGIAFIRNLPRGKVRR